MVLGVGQQLEAELLQELDIFVEIPDDQLDMVDAFYHNRVSWLETATSYGGAHPRANSGLGQALS